MPQPKTSDASFNARVLELEVELKQVQELNLSLQRFSLDCVKVMDLEGNLISMNEPGLKVMEIDDFKTYEGKSWLDFWQGQDRQAALKALKTASRGQAGHFTGYTPTAKGHYKWWDVVIAPIHDEQGKVVKLLGVTRDISPQRFIESEMVNTQHQLEFLSEASKVLSKSLDYHVTMKNVAKIAVPEICDWCSVDIVDESGELEQLAVVHSDPKQVRWAQKYRQEHKPRKDSAIWQVINTKTSLLAPVITDEMLAASAITKKELALVKALKLRSVMMVPIVVNNQAVGAISFVSTNDTRIFDREDLRVAEELAARASLTIHNAKLYHSAQESEQRFKAFIDSNIVGVFVADGQGTIIEANDGFLKLLGYTQEDVKSRKLNRHQITPSEYRKLSEQALTEMKKTRSSMPWEKEYIRADGTRVPVIVGSILVDPKTGQNITIVLDITERKKLEQRKDEFIGIASHELKTPLTSIKGYVQILERIIEEMGDERAKVLISKTNTYISRMNTLISDLLDVSRIQAGKLQFNLEEFDITDVVAQGIDAIRPTANRHEIVCQECEPVIITGDANRLEQVFMNLLSNAVKYSPESKKIYVNIKKEDKQVVVSVRDFGIGIPKSQHHKLFRRFYRVQRTAEQFSGLGIGLYISSEIVKRHHGKIWVESEEGQGSTFYFSLPLQTLKTKKIRSTKSKSGR